MKKLTGIFLSVILLLSAMSICVQGLEVSEIDNMSVKYNKVQYSLYKVKSKLQGKTETEVAKEILMSIGLSENMVNHVDGEKLSFIYNSVKVESSAAEAVVEVSSAENKWAKLNTVAFQNADDRTGYLYVSVCEWLKTPIWRGQDFQTLSVLEGNIVHDSAIGIFECSKFSSSQNTTNYITDKYKSSDFKHFSSLPRAICFSNNLTSDGRYSNFISVIMVNGLMGDAPFISENYVSSEYYHKNILGGFYNDADAIFSREKLGITYSRIQSGLNITHKM